MFFTQLAVQIQFLYLKEKKDAVLITFFVTIFNNYSLKWR